jgi:hypothetical protein
MLETKILITPLLEAGFSQRELISLYARAERARGAGAALDGHLDHLQLCLRKMIEVYGPNDEYYAWLNSISSK